MYLDRIIILTCCFCVPLFQHLLWLPFPPSLNSSAWPSRLSRICSTFSLLSPSHAFLFKTQFCSTPMAAFVSWHLPNTISFTWMPLSYSNPTVLLDHFPNETFFDNYQNHQKHCSIQCLNHAPCHSITYSFVL